MNEIPDVISNGHLLNEFDVAAPEWNISLFDSQRAADELLCPAVNTNANAARIIAGDGRSAIWGKSETSLFGADAEDEKGV